MPIATRDLDNGVTVVAIDGRIDILGAQQIDMPMSIIAGSKRSVVLDLSGVTFLASLGIRSMLVAAKSIASKGGACVMYGPNEDVRGVLETCGIDTIVPIFAALDEAVLAAAKR
jgi:anti-anti-sigma factor